METLLTPFCADVDQTRREASLLVALIDGFGVRLTLLPDAYGRLGEEQNKIVSELHNYLETIVKQKR